MKKKRKAQKNPFHMEKKLAGQKKATIKKKKNRDGQKYTEALQIF